MQKRVLVVDDDPSLLTLLGEILGGDGYAVETAANGAEALHRVRQAPPDVVVTDLVMPVMDGWSLIAACRAEFPAADLPIVVVSAYPMEQSARRLGANVCLRKPFDLHAFLAAVERLAEDRPRSRA